MSTREVTAATNKEIEAEKEVVYKDSQ